jgi:Uma2 family endonuclease
MGTATRLRGFTFDEFCLLVKEDQKADLIDGVIYMASPEGREANELFGWIFSLLTVYVQRHKLGKVYGTRVAFRLDRASAPEPDIAFVSKERLDQPDSGYFIGPPDLAVEVVSPESAERDYVKKRAKYEEAGVREYWIVDQILEKVTWLQLGGKGKFREVRPKKGVFSSRVLPGCWLRPRWLWQDPPPDIVETFEEIRSAVK